MALRSIDLMIGDWVRVRLPWRCPVDGHIENRWYTRQVTGIRTNGTDAEKYYLDFRPWGVLPRDIEPIPLTPEILVKNGWRAIWGWWSINACPFWLVKYTKNSSGEGRWGVRFNDSDDDDSFLISTVHELQHVLRLCGIDKDIELLEL